MEFRLSLDQAAPGLDDLRDACLAEDPSAMLDIAPEGDAVRIATQLDAATLVSVLAQSGWPLAPGQLRQLPSVCCGGCSG